MNEVKPKIIKLNENKGKILSFTPNAISVLEKRYLKKDINGKPIETPEDLFRRVAKTIAEADKKFGIEDTTELENQFYNMMTNLDFLPNSPTLMNAGRELGQLSACFVLPVGDSMEEIFETIKNTALIHKTGGGTGFSFSRLRPANDIVKTTSGVSSGPIPFMKAFDAATEAVKQGGTRRGANMGILRVDHPDIMDFIMCKNDNNSLNNFNISVGLTEKFMEAVEKDEDYDLINPRTKSVVKRLNARKVFERLVKQAWKNGEPGIIFLDRLNKANPTPHIGEFEATNPCGEQPLLPYESCNLGSINLANMVNKNNKVDWEKLKENVHSAVHFLDNVIEVNKYPLPEIDKMTKANRKIGLGIMGWADMLIQLNIPYNTEEALELADKVMSFIQREGYKASQNLAKTRGAFPNFKGSIHDRPDKEPMRNATVTTIAPTGTISIIANTTSGIEPLFAVCYYRNVMDGTKLVEINPFFKNIAIERGFYSEELMQKIAKKGSIQDIEEIPEDVRKVFVTAHDISPEYHVKMQAVFQKYTDNAVSKTINFCNKATIEDVEQAYILAYKLGCKGITIYRDGSREGQVLNLEKEEKKEKKEVNIKRERPKALKGATYQMKTGCGALYITINEDNTGLFELFTTMGKAGGCASSQCEAIGRLVSLAWRSGVSAKQVIKQLVGISCHKPSGFGENKVLSCADAVAKAIEIHLKSNGHDVDIEKRVFTSGACPECGSPLEHESGCVVCKNCSYSECG